MIDEYESPYCPDCNACGESGCCPASQCKKTENCLYRRIYSQQENYGLSDEKNVEGFTFDGYYKDIESK